MTENDDPQKSFHVDESGNIYGVNIPEEDDPPLIVGDRCRLISGGPLLLVVETSEIGVTVAYEDGRAESILPRNMVRRTF